MVFVAITLNSMYTVCESITRTPPNKIMSYRLNNRNQLSVVDIPFQHQNYKSLRWSYAWYKRLWGRRFEDVSVIIEFGFVWSQSLTVYRNRNHCACIEHYNYKVLWTEFQYKRDKRLKLVIKPYQRIRRTCMLYLYNYVVFRIYRTRVQY